VRGYFLASDSGKLRGDDQKKFVFGHFFLLFVHFEPFRGKKPRNLRNLRLISLRALVP